MTVSKRELKLSLNNLHPLDVGLVFKVYKRLNYSDIQLDKPSGRNDQCVIRGSVSGTKGTKHQKKSRIRLKYLEFIKYLAENLLEINVKDLGHLQSSELQEIFQYIRENENLISKIYSSHKLENLIFSILKTHLIFVLQTSALLSDIHEIKTLINALWNLLLSSEVKIEDLFHCMNNDELIQIYNLTSYFSEYKHNIVLDENLNSMLSNILNISKAKIKNHLNFLLLYSLDGADIIQRSAMCNWFNLIDSEDILISNEDVLLYFILKNFEHYDQVEHIIRVIRFNFLSDSAKFIYNQIQNSNVNINFSKRRYFADNTVSVPMTLKKPRFTFLNKVLGSSQLPIVNKHLVIHDNLKSDGCFSYEIQILNKSKMKLPGNYNDLVKTWQLFLGFTISNGQETQPFVFDLFSVLYENSNLHEKDKVFRHRSILKSSKPNFITCNTPSIYRDITPDSHQSCRDECKKYEAITKEGVKLRYRNRGEVLEENRVIFAVNWIYKFIVVEVGSLFSVYIDIKNSFPQEIPTHKYNEMIFPIISYNGEYFNVSVNYYSCNLEINGKSSRSSDRKNMDCSKRFAGSKTRRKGLMEVSKKQSGAPKRATRLRPSGSTNIVTPIESPSPSPICAISPTNRRGRPRKHALPACINEVVSLDSKQEFHNLPPPNISNNSYSIESTKSQGTNNTVIKNIKKKIRYTTKRNRYSCSSSSLARLFANSLNRLFDFFSNRLICLLTYLK
ncbi:hypothetical protein OJ252_1658 [Cryptosporidium canis]|uniref:Uncharacterized protein n=1 Tax=Cryptosporidium canis TaxID=195482 RepID=A0ABQ8P7J5_9CRYT|nr:hypothetical protein OJ252_1658 [Cryptosporidium canis]